MDDAPSAAPTATLSDTIAHGYAVTAVPGSLIGRYVVVDHLGAGGMGSVYAAYDTQLARRVAVKVLRPDALIADGRARLLREAQAMARLAHPNVVSVHDVGEYGDDVFIAMEYIEGRTLKAWMREGHAWREALAVLKAAGRGLAAAHAAGLVHRDFKPENVLIGNDGRVVVADFGIARAQSPEPTEPERAPSSSRAPSTDHAPALSAEAVTSPGSSPGSSTEPSALETPLTETGALIGTAGYMAPERAFEFHDDARSDQFSFAVTLYRVLYGQPPFVYSNVSTYLTALLSAPRPPPAGTRVPAWVHAVISRGLEYEAANRFASMEDLLAALDRDPTRRRRLWALALATIGLAGGAVLGWEHQRSVVREECKVGERLMAETWNPGVRDTVGAAIRATDAPRAAEIAERTERVLGDWAAAWTSAHREASEATRLRGIESTTTMNIRLDCLERERGQTAALIDRLAHPDRVIARHALLAAYELPQPRVCWEPNAARAAALPEAPAPRARVLALERLVAEASALSVTGGCDKVIPVLTQGIEEARAIPHRESEAALLLFRSECERERGGPDEAVATRQEAFAAAIAAGDDSLAASIAAKVAFELGDDLAKVHEAERWLKIGRGVLEREGHDDRAEAELLVSEASTLSGEGYPERTLKIHERAILLLTKVYGPESPALASELNNFSTDLGSVGQKEESIVQLRRGIAISESVFGPKDPMLHVDYNNLGVAYTLLGRYDEAREALDHALVLVGPLGETNSNAIVVWASMAVLENLAGRPNVALDDASRAMAIAKVSGDNGARFLPCLFEERGTALLSSGDPRGAIEACAHALKLQEELEVIGPDKLYTDDALTCLGRAELAVGKVDDAIAHLERGVTLKKRDWKEAFPFAEFALAKALGAAGRDPGRARELAESALRELRGATGVEAQAREVETWLAGPGGKR
ncbi:MAG: protein kinase domain-containing protein [Polyangiaceae bacterium]